MATFGKITDDCARKLIDENNTAVARSTIQDAINEAIRYWKPKRLWFNTAGLAVTLAEADTTLTQLPADFLADVPRNALTIVVNNFPFRVRKVAPVIYDGNVNNNGTGRPLIYCYRNQAIEIYPYPDKDYDGHFYYIKDYEDFLTDGTQDDIDNDWTVEAEALIRSQALAYLHAEERQDFDTADKYSMRAEREYNNLLGRTNLLLRSGSMAVEG